uniref:Zinc finger protein 830-like isoform X1 n=1 Tax=Rhizophora mucronata TaxID=61149 RepID=A0A2P2K5X1_RHIMU
MDPAKKKALFRAKLNAQKKEKRIISPLVRYNEIDQPICRVCNVVLKSESLWDAHQSSRKHHEAINNLRATAAKRPHDDSVSEPITELDRHKDAHKAELDDAKYETSVKLSKTLPSSALPPDFFDKHEAKRQKTGSDTAKSVNKEGSIQSKAEESFLEDKLNEVPNENDGLSKKIELSSDFSSIPAENTGSETKQIKGALPEGFFDNKESDLRARGIKPVKPDVKDEYKEFEKLIQEDLQEVDDRLGEEEGP